MREIRLYPGEKERSDSEGGWPNIWASILLAIGQRAFLLSGKEGISIKRAAIISVILSDPRNTQRPFNDIVSDYNDIVRGRMGIPFDASGIALISLTVVAELDRINAFTGKLGKLPGVMVKAAVAREEVRVE